MKMSLVHAMTCAALSLLLLPAPLEAYEFDVPGFLGTHGCANLATDVALPGVESIPEKVILQLKVDHAPGERLSCVGPPFSEGASFFSLTETVPGMRSDATGSLPAQAGTSIIEIEFENYLGYFDMTSVPIELWISIHPDQFPVICSDWAECPTVTITAATLIVELAVATETSTWGEIKAIFN